MQTAIFNLLVFAILLVSLFDMTFVGHQLEEKMCEVLSLGYKRVKELKEKKRKRIREQRKRKYRLGFP